MTRLELIEACAETALVSGGLSKEMSKDVDWLVSAIRERDKEIGNLRMENNKLKVIVDKALELNHQTIDKWKRELLKI